MLSSILFMIYTSVDTYLNCYDDSVVDRLKTEIKSTYSGKITEKIKDYIENLYGCGNVVNPTLNEDGVDKKFLDEPFFKKQLDQGRYVIKLVDGYSLLDKDGNPTKSIDGEPSDKLVKCTPTIAVKRVADQLTKVTPRPIIYETSEGCISDPSKC